MTSRSEHRVAVDIGGTFTDLAWYDADSGALKFEKVLSTPPNFAAGVHASLRKAGVSASEIHQFVHGSTVAVNAVIQKTGARTALVTTAGFEDVYEIGRANRPDTYNLLFEKPQPLVPGVLRFGVRERMSAKGEVIRPIDLASVKTIASKLRKAKVEAVAVCLLHSYVNPAHEIAVGRILKKVLPEAFVTLSHEILREYREYERASTAVLNCYVGPEVSRYLKAIDEPLRHASFNGVFHVMQSNGGVMTAARATQAPVAMMESGPAGGIIGAAVLGRELGEDNVIAFDMGGTTAKACLVENGLPRMTDQYYVGGYREGYPMRLPVVDIIEVGAGGGSVAWIDPGGALKVGPRSAGSQPGPVCYGRGGREPTVTDANLVTGRIDGASFLGGEMPLDLDGAREAISHVVGKPLGLGLIEAAQGILKIADARMAAIVRAITLQRGLDPRDFTLIAFGGGGPLHASVIARELNIPRVIIPPQPGHFSALGMLLTDLRHDLVQTWVVDLDAIGGPALEEALKPLETLGRRSLTEQNVRSEDIQILRSVDMRYAGQEYTVSVPVPHDLGGDALGALRASFDAIYDRRYGHSDPATPAQVVTLRVAAIGQVRKPELLGSRETASAMPLRHRPVYFEDEQSSIDTPVIQRRSLKAGDTFSGPVIVEEHASTTVVEPGGQITVAANGCLILEVPAS